MNSSVAATLCRHLQSGHFILYELGGHIFSTQGIVSSLVYILYLALFLHHNDIRYTFLQTDSKKHFVFYNRWLTFLIQHVSFMFLQDKSTVLVLSLLSLFLDITCPTFVFYKPNIRHIFIFKPMVNIFYFYTCQI